MKLLRAATLAAVAGLAPAALAGWDFGSWFDALNAELQGRRDNNYEGELDKTQKTELKALEKAIKAMEKDHDESGQAIMVMKKVATTLEKGFPSEFSDTGYPSNLRSLCYGVNQGIAEDLSQLHSDLSSQAPGLPEGPASEKAAAALSEASEALSEYYNNPYDFGEAWKHLARANKALLKAQRIIEKAFPQD